MKGAPSFAIIDNEIGGRAFKTSGLAGSMAWATGKFSREAMAHAAARDGYGLRSPVASEVSTEKETLANILGITALSCTISAARRFPDWRQTHHRHHGGGEEPGPGGPGGAAVQGGGLRIFGGIWDKGRRYLRKGGDQRTHQVPSFKERIGTISAVTWPFGIT